MVFSQGRVQHPDRYAPSDPDRYGPSDPAEFHASPDLAALEPALDRHFRQGRLRGGGLANRRRSIGSQALRAVTYGLLIIVIAGLPLAWQFGDKNTKQMIEAWAIPLDEWSSVFGAKSSPVAAETASTAAHAAKTVSKISDRAPTPDTSALQAAARNVLPAPAPMPAGSSQVLQHQLEAISSDLTVVRRIVEQLAAAQGQMAEELATVQAAEHDISQKRSPASQAAAHAPPHKNVPKPMPLEALPQSSAAPSSAARPQEPPPLH